MITMFGDALTCVFGSEQEPTMHTFGSTEGERLSAVAVK